MRWPQPRSIGITFQLMVFAQASDAFELAKAKELAHHYRWRASKIAPKLYGDRLQVEGKFTVDWAQVCQESVKKYKQKHGGS
jgi:hypothetical protein